MSMSVGSVGAQGASHIVVRRAAEGSKAEEAQESPEAKAAEANGNLGRHLDIKA